MKLLRGPDGAARRVVLDPAGGEDGAADRRTSTPGSGPPAGPTRPGKPGNRYAANFKDYSQGIQPCTLRTEDLGGVVNLVSRKPGQRREGNLETGVASGGEVFGLSGFWNSLSSWFVQGGASWLAGDHAEASQRIPRRNGPLSRTLPATPRNTSLTLVTTVM
jgi:hypothetical protein